MTSQRIEAMGYHNAPVYKIRKQKWLQPKRGMGSILFYYAFIARQALSRTVSLSPLTFKMAPWPEQGHEPKAPDKLSKARDAASCDYPKVNLMPSDNVELIDKTTKGDDKQYPVTYRVMLNKMNLSRKFMAVMPSVAVLRKNINLTAFVHEISCGNTTCFAMEAVSAGMEDWVKEGSRRKFVDEEEKVSAEENCGVSTLDDGQLKALLDEAITYKCPKDREGKSDLFRSSALDQLFLNYGSWAMFWCVAEREELLQEAEADETKKSDCQQKHHVIKSGEIGGARASTGGRRRKRDGGYITERQTKGGSLQNIPQEVNAEFDHESSFSYCLRGASGSGTRRKKRSSGSFRDSGVSVSARQREGGSLPSNVDGGSGGMLTLSHLDLPSTSASLRFEEVRHPKLTIPCMRRDVPGYTYIGTNDADTSMTPVRDGESYSGSATSDFMVIEVGNLGLVDHENALEETASGGNGLSRQRKFSGDLSNMKPGDEGIEMEMINPASNIRGRYSPSRGPTSQNGLVGWVLNRNDCTSSSNIKYTSHATLEVGPERRRDQTDLTNVVTFPLSSCEKHLVNGVEQVSLQFPTTYNSVKCIRSANTTTTTIPTTTMNTTSNSGGSSNTNISRESSKVIDQEFNKKKAVHIEVLNPQAGVCAGGELIRKCCSDTNKPTMVYTGVPVTHHMSVLSIPPNSLIATSLRTVFTNDLDFAVSISLP
uniref:Uncharacterized protein n=1 Tax=Timema bartmani TaxID=61472 RepID=A0A7R9EVW9_9NEOP|nr:unnamed protein product [Timema bartmani]